MKTVICPGSFNPITNGHLDIIRRASLLFDRVVVAVLRNAKKDCEFSVEERVEMIRDCVADLPNVEVAWHDGLLADYAKSIGAVAIVRGLRAVTDFENEFQMALVNRELNGEAQTIFFTASPEYMFLSSSAVREVASHGADISNFVPPQVVDRVAAKYKKEV